MTNAHSKPSLDGLTGLRFFAALWVVLFHVRPLFLPDVPLPAFEFVSMGFVGVGLFFMLSGFVLGYQYTDRDSTSRAGRRRFMIARFARIYPVYLLGLALTFPSFWQDSVDLISVGLRTQAQLLGTLFGNATLLQAWTPWTSCQWNCPGWSLSSEAFFYLGFPLIAAAVARLGTGRLVAVAALLYPLALLAPALYSYSPAVQHWVAQSPERLILANAFIQYTPLLRLPEFIAGILLARVFTMGVRVPAWGGVAAVGLAVLFGCFWRTLGTPDLMVSNGLLMPLFALLILSVAGGRDWLGSVLASRPLIWLGEASYATYILHFFLLRALQPRLAGLGLPHGLQLALYLAVTVAASLVTFVCLEKPARRWLKTRLEALLVDRLPRAAQAATP
ncbi:peptidoglycan/LPS O-acetylase OafA/YrhL [Azospirillum agricola]|uniref:acyltransferase family protein n=1 Tax=Azospirillum agricola TaxID=1720247 RepID=UPI001AE6DD37|nr:acyltransferase [Azospirillum agricola]MBP2232954.1 peptidoglycan/LPS O-acetylase OafA/YrhL [Azospirillum agricola]